MGRYVRDEILNQPEDFVQYMMLTVMGLVLAV